MPGIYLKQEDRYIAMSEAAYAAEDILQKLIAEHPEMLTSDDGGHGPLLLIRREAPIADLEESGGRWSLDHLYLDSDGVPTLVEVKRSSDSRGRREVVAQMLEYAANAKTSFNVTQLQDWLEQTAAARGTTADQAVRDFGVENPDAFWNSVQTNLDAERLRLIFVSDGIRRELRRIVEFLNGQMKRTDVLAIEVKQFTGGDGQQIIAPRLIGDTEKARQTKGRRSRKLIDRDELMTAMRTRSANAATAADEVLKWAEAHPRLTVDWSAAGNIRLGTRILLRLWEDATLEIQLSHLQSIDPAWDDDRRIADLIHRLESINGVAFRGNRKWPRTPLAPLVEAANREQFLAIIDEVIATVPAT